MRRGHVVKTELLPNERLSAAYWHLIGGIAQHDIAALYHVNQGRVATAIAAVRKAIKDVDDKGETDES